MKLQQAVIALSFGAVAFGCGVEQGAALKSSESMQADAAPPGSNSAASPSAPAPASGPATDGGNPSGGGAGPTTVDISTASLKSDYLAAFATTAVTSLELFPCGSRAEAKPVGTVLRSSEKGIVCTGRTDGLGEEVFPGVYGEKCDAGTYASFFSFVGTSVWGSVVVCKASDGKIYVSTEFSAPEQDYPDGCTSVKQSIPAKLCDGFKIDYAINATSATDLSALTLTYGGKTHNITAYKFE